MEKFARAMAKACRLKLEQNEEKKRKKKKEKVKEKYILYCICVCSSSVICGIPPGGSRLGPNRLLSVTLLSKKCYSNSIVLGMYLMQLRGSLNMHAACMLFHIITSYPGTL